MCRAETVERSLGRKTINACFIPFLPHAADQQMVSDGDELLLMVNTIFTASLGIFTQVTPKLSHISDTSVTRGNSRDQPLRVFS